MHISVVTLFPELYRPFVSTSIIGRAQERGQIHFSILNLLDHCAPKERVDGPTFGHGAGMVLRPEVVERAVDGQEREHGKSFKIFFSPRGKRLDQDLLRELHAKLMHVEHLMLLPARYEGMDSRIEDEYADATLSVGDFVVMGGDLPAMLFLEGFLRLIPGVVGKQGSVEHDSFSGALVDYPEYTAPVVWKGREVPEVVRSGNHKLLAEWRQEKALELTVKNHFSWLRRHWVSSGLRDAVLQKIPPHYAILMHAEVLLPDGTVGTTSVTSLDIHDIARSARTYGLRGYYLVTPLDDQRRIVRKLLDFWQTGVGVSYNPHRHEALKEVRIAESLEAALADIALREKQEPLLVVTSARPVEGNRNISFFEQQVFDK